MHKVLIVTYYWPPAGGPGVQRWLYFASYLREFDVQPVIYTPKNPHYPILDPGLESQVPSEITVCRKKIWEPHGLAGFISRKGTRRISSGILDREKPSLTERGMRWIRGNFFIPDARIFWVRPSVRFLKPLIAAEGITMVITTGPPHSMHLIGLRLKQSTGVRWAADFRDPWTSIGYHEALYPGKRAQYKHKKLEAMVLREADTLITTSGRTRDEFRQITDRPIHVITNGYSGARNRKGQPAGNFRLAHIGSLLSGRNPIALWKALKNLVDKNGDFRNDLEIELTGLVSEGVLDSIRENDLEPFLKRSRYVPHGRALEKQRQAQVLLLLEINADKTRGIIPGKLFEYMAASRPVLAIGPKGWEAGEIVEGCECGASFEYGDQEAIESKILEWYQAYKQGILEVKGKGVSQFHRRALTERFVKDILWA
ncbi:MAG: glycosyltransferase family 4 protein [Robiginitalea sp.]